MAPNSLPRSVGPGWHLGRLDDELPGRGWRGGGADPANDPLYYPMLVSEGSVHLRFQV